MDKRILIPGWAGSLEPDELKFVIKALKRRPGLRVKWGFKKESKEFSAKKVQHIASTIKEEESIASSIKQQD